ncbi:hypothetical protein AgCh_034852 [Apium graveolens]
MGNRNGPSNHLGELLRLRQEEDSGDDHGRNFVSGQTLGSVINADKDYPTLLDVLRQDSGGKNKKKWKGFKEKLRLRRGGSAWCSASRMLISDVVMNNTILNNRMIMGRGEMQENLSRIGQSREMVGPGNDVTPENTAVVVAEEGGEEGPARLSLMALLESEMEMGFETEFIVEDEVAEDDGDVEGGGGGGAGEMNGGGCCVCMVRDKGSAFIPCGHTFCRLCSRELWVKRGNCPLCNTKILEILDIF